MMSSSGGSCLRTILGLTRYTRTRTLSATCQQVAGFELSSGHNYTGGRQLKEDPFLYLADSLSRVVESARPKFRQCPRRHPAEGREEYYCITVGDTHLMKMLNPHTLCPSGTDLVLSLLMPRLRMSCSVISSLERASRGCKAEVRGRVMWTGIKFTFL